MKLIKSIIGKLIPEIKHQRKKLKISGMGVILSIKSNWNLMNLMTMKICLTIEFGNGMIKISLFSN